MGLFINSSSEYEYHYSYRALHYVRHMAYVAAGGKLDYDSWHEAYKLNREEVMISFRKFPNIIWHSDCEGNYTPDGKVDSIDEPTNGLTTGNSTQLLAELREVRDTLRENPSSLVSEDSWNIFQSLYDLVEDEVENYDGVLEFC